MLNLTVNNKQINVPTSWSELTTEKYIKLNNLIALYRDEETGELNVESEILFQKVAQIVLNMTRDEILNLDFKMIIAIKASFSFLNEAMPEPKIVKTIKYKEHIIKIKDYNRLTFGQFADIQQIMGAEKKDELKIIAKIIDLYEPKNILKLRFRDKKIDISDDQKIKIINDLPSTEFNNLVFFFTRLMVKYMRTTARSFEVMAVKMNAGVAFRAAGVIIRLCYHWLITKLTWWKKPQT